MHTIYLGIGTNLGDRQANLLAVQEALPPAIELVAASPVYETLPWGYADQPTFLNQVLKAQTGLSPSDLLARVKELENDLGRRPSFTNGPRLIDIDILFYDDLMLDTPALTIPHPRMEGRAFVWIPLADVAPDLRHPITGKTPPEVLAEMDTSGVHKYQEI